MLTKVWVNSHRDHSIYERLIPSIGFFEDEATGFHGPLMGMKSAWTHVQSDYVLFVPCDVTFIPKKVISRLHQAMQRDPNCDVVIVEINDQCTVSVLFVKTEQFADIDSAP